MSHKVVMNTVGISGKGNQSILLCAGEIAGATIYHHTVIAGSSVEFAPDSGCFHILILAGGTAVFETDGKTYSFKERMTFIPEPGKSLKVNACIDVQILEIQWLMIESDVQELTGYNTTFPIIKTYLDSKHYTDSAKSEKTISRIMVEQRNIPRFCMGSVESYGYDIVMPHNHPMLDQFFFSFPENEMDVIIDGEHIHMSGNTLMHIPLGAKHGAEVYEGKHMHYIWMDFMVDDTAMAVLDAEHIPTGVTHSFDKEKK